MARQRGRYQPPPLPEPALFVVIYDARTVEGWLEESYYGYFDTAEQAERLYLDMIRGKESFFRNARVCQQVKIITP